MPRKLPIARLSSASAAAATMPPTVPPLESLNPIADAAQSPTQLVNTVPLATFIPVYCAQALAVNNEQVLPHVYTISSSDVAPTANALPHGAYDNAYHADSSIYVQATEQFTDNDSFPVELDSAFSMAPVEIVDLNACPEACGEATNLPSFTWSNTDDGLYPDSAAMDIDGQRYRSTWLQPISLFTNHPDSQGGGEMPAVDEAFPSNADVNL